jgi:hypothetical protein
VKDDGVQNEQTEISLDSMEADNPQQVVSSIVGVASYLPQKFDKLHLSMNEEEIVDQGCETITAGATVNPMDDFITIDCLDYLVVQLGATKQNPTTIETINCVNANLGPIVDYAREPLLPLVKACAPLIGIFHNLSIYVQLALDETPEEPPDGLTIDESAAIRLYTMEWEKPHRSLYSTLNYTLKTASRVELRPYFKYLKLFLTGLVKLPCVPPLTVWRGVTKNLSADFPPGTPVTWWAFSSCTTALTVLENNMYLGDAGERTLLSVEAINGRTVRAHSHFVTEDEILLLPGTHMIVQSQFSPAPDLHIIHLKQVIPDEILLEPPFEGIWDVFNCFFLQ